LPNAGEVSQIGIRDLAMTDDSVKRHGIEGRVVGPKLVTGQAHERRYQCLGRLSRLSLTEKKPDQIALSDGTGGDRLRAGREPCLRGFVMDVIVNKECNQHIGVKQNSH
jgi:hypothetical protein